MKLIVFFFLLLLSLHAKESNIEKVSIQLELVPASKAVIQWERVFSSDRRMKKYNIDQLSTDVQEKLKEYLIAHAADSNQPMVPGL